jgi:hypothetical protein
MVSRDPSNRNGASPYPPNPPLLTTKTKLTPQQGIAAVANWLFNFALGLFVPPGFANISWKLFIVFGVLCFGAAAQAFFTYPETAGKTIEEIEEMFSKGGPRPWHTKPGNSKLDAAVADVRERKLSIAHVERRLASIDDGEKGHGVVKTEEQKRAEEKLGMTSMIPEHM